MAGGEVKRAGIRLLSRRDGKCSAIGSESSAWLLTQNRPDNGLFTTGGVSAVRANEVRTGSARVESTNTRSRTRTGAQATYISWTTTRIPSMVASATCTWPHLRRAPLASSQECASTGWKRPAGLREEERAEARPMTQVPFIKRFTERYQRECFRRAVDDGRLSYISLGRVYYGADAAKLADCMYPANPPDRIGQSQQVVVNLYYGMVDGLQVVGDLLKRAGLDTMGTIALLGDKWARVLVSPEGVEQITVWSDFPAITIRDRLTTEIVEHLWDSFHGSLGLLAGSHAGGLLLTQQTDDLSGASCELFCWRKQER